MLGLIFTVYLIYTVHNIYITMTKPWNFSKIFLQGFWWIFTILAIRKSYQGLMATRYVRKCWNLLSPEAFKNNAGYQKMVEEMEKMSKPPAILLLNQYALPMTLNWLCNTAQMDQVHERIIFLTLDSTARDTLAKLWPQIKQFYFPNNCFKHKFTFGDPTYQALYSLRSNLATALAESGQSFWMMQQDTFWRKNLFELGLEEEEGYDLLFDQIGSHDHSLRAQWINGANFFVRPSATAKQYFDFVGKTLRWLYAPDMGLMIYQCGTNSTSRCSYMPHRLVNCWEWMFTDRTDPPYLLQLDCETDNGGKIGQMKKLGFYFMNEDGRTCNQSAVDLAQTNMERGFVDSNSQSWGRFQFGIYWYIADLLLRIPILGPLWKPYLPMLGFYFLITV